MGGERDLLIGTSFGWTSSVIIGRRKRMQGFARSAFISASAFSWNLLVGGHGIFCFDGKRERERENLDMVTWQGRFPLF